jgi:hypothetical protein
MAPTAKLWDALLVAAPPAKSLANLEIIKVQAPHSRPLQFKQPAGSNNKSNNSKSNVTRNVTWAFFIFFFFFLSFFMFLNIAFGSK